MTEANIAGFRCAEAGHRVLAARLDAHAARIRDNPVVAAGGIGTSVYDKVTAPGAPPGLLATLNQSTIAPLSGSVSSLAFSPDGRTLAASADGIGLSTSSGGAFLDRDASLCAARYLL